MEKIKLTNCKNKTNLISNYKERIPSETKRIKTKKKMEAGKEEDRDITWRLSNLKFPQKITKFIAFI